jgi:hypothetical protein
MEHSDLLKKAEEHLHLAETELGSGGEEGLAEHNVAAAIDELEHELEELKEHEIFLEIVTPNGPFRGIFAEDTKVSEVITIVVDKKKLDNKDTFELFHGDTQLQPTDRTLASFGLKRKAKLVLVAQGSGV